MIRLLEEIVKVLTKILNEIISSRKEVKKLMSKVADINLKLDEQELTLTAVQDAQIKEAGEIKDLFDLVKQGQATDAELDAIGTRLDNHIKSLKDVKAAIEGMSETVNPPAPPPPPAGEPA